MKWLLLGLGLAAAAVGLAAVMRGRRDDRSTDCVDGGVVRYHDGADSPKVIESTEITEFHCTFSLYAVVETGKLGNGKYTCSAILKNDAVSCSIKWQTRMGEGGERVFTADRAFMIQLQELVSTHAFALHNGRSHSVSGLPDMYGAKLEVRYASGESIYTYDNQNNFLKQEAMDALFTLFTTANEKEQ